MEEEVKRLVKSAPTANNYRSDYDVSFGLIDRISQDTMEPWSSSVAYPPLPRDEVLNKLLNGETVKVMNPFGTEVLWTLEEEATDAINPADVLAYIDQWKGQENDPEEVRDFVQTMAQLIAEGKTLADAEAAGYSDFVERLKGTAR